MPGSIPRILDRCMERNIDVSEEKVVAMGREFEHALRPPRRFRRHERSWLTGPHYRWRRSQSASPRPITWG